jgi:signal transduction histidine kinase
MTVHRIFLVSAVIALAVLTGGEWRVAVLAAVVLLETALVTGLVTIDRRRRSAERDLHDVSRRLIEAQEDERRRIARELHDHLSQELALLAIDLQQLATSVPASSRGLAGRLDSLHRRTNEIATDVHGLAYRLHPAKLETLGLPATIRRHCHDIARQGVVAHFSEGAAPASIPPDVSLCLFRVAEEALSNVVRHSRAAEARVSLHEADRHLVLRIEDAGRGFAQSDRQAHAGLGLVSMRERLRSVDGRLEIATAPGRGVIVEARVPLRPSAPAPATSADSGPRLEDARSGPISVHGPPVRPKYARTG